jgi:transcriptional regulator of acetoin/glycerol metabolism
MIAGTGRTTMSKPLITKSSRVLIPHDDLIRASWDRALGSGLNPDSVIVNESAPDVDTKSELAEAARKVIDTTAALLDDTNTWISFADPQGVVTYEWAASGGFRKELDRLNVVRGAIINESVVGTSGVALALASEQTVMVSGGEHFNSRWRDLVCAASPVMHPLTAEVLGAVNITCMASDENKHLRIALRTLVNGFQQVLSQGLRSQQRRLLDAHIRTKEVTKSPVITLDSGMIIEDKELEGLRLTHAEIREFVGNLRPDARNAIMPNGRKVNIIRHKSDGLETIFSIVFDPIEIQTFSMNLLASAVPNLVGQPELKLLDRVERDAILATLRMSKGNKSIAAQTLGVSRGTLYERIRKYGLVEFLRPEDQENIYLMPKNKNF